MSGRGTFPGRLAAMASRGFVFWVLAAAVLAYWRPETFAGIAPWIAPLLGVVMLGMGLTLQPADFRRVLRRPGDVLAGAAAQWLLMPPGAWALAVVLRLPPELAAGVILVGAAPGGTASNVVTLLARGDVALSVSITAVTTLAAPLVMPFWVLALLGEQIQVGFWTLFRQIALIVLIPVLCGVLLRQFLDRLAPRTTAEAVRVFPMISMLAIAVIVAAIVAINVDALARLGLPLAMAVLLHNGLGLAGGAVTGHLIGMTPDRIRTCCFEVGMQNSGLAVALAVAHFGPAAALPGALFSVWHNVTGAALASWLTRRRK